VAELNAMQRKFVEAYTGNATEAARIAGYKEPQSQGSRLLKNVEIQKALKERSNKANRVIKKHIMNREQRQAFLTEVVANQENEMKDRLKACDQLSKIDGDYINKVEVTGAAGGPLSFRWDGDG